MIYATITPEEFSEWVNLCAGGFEMPPDEFYDHFVNDPLADYDGVFAAFDDSVGGGTSDCASFGCSAARGNMTSARGRMVSSVRIFTRHMYINGQVVKCGAVGEVCTLREYRGLGLSGKLLSMAIEYMKNNGFAVSQLFTGVNDHYVRHGWFTVPLQYADISLSCDAADGFALRAVCADDVPALSALHGEYARMFDGVFVRCEGDPGRKYWIDWMARNPGHRLAAVDGSGAVAAYLDFNVDGGKLIFREYLGAPKLALPLWKLAADNYAGGASVLSAVPRPVAEWLCGDIVRLSERRNCMYRLNLPFEAGGRLIDSDALLRSALCDAVTFEADNY